MTSSAEPRGPACRQAQQKETQRREYGDVAAGNSDDVVRARFLQAALHVVVQAPRDRRSESRHHGGRPRAPGADARRNRSPDRRAWRTPRLPPTACPRAVTSTSLSLFTEPTSADTAPGHCRSASRTPGSRYRVWPSERRRKCDAPAGAPLQNLIARQPPADADQARLPSVACLDAVQLDAIDEHVERHARRPVHGVCAQPRLNRREDLMLARLEMPIEHCAQRRVARRRIRAAAEHEASTHETERDEERPGAARRVASNNATRGAARSRRAEQQD